MQPKRYVESISHKIDHDSFQRVYYPNLFSSENFNKIKTSKYLPSGLNFIKQGPTQCEFDEPFGNSIRAYITAAAGIMSVIAGTINPILGPLAIAGGVVNQLLPILWPENSTVKDQKLMCEVGVLVDKRLNAFVLEQATKQLEGLEEVIREYRDAVKSFQDNRLPRNVTAEWVRTQFQIVHSAIINAIPTFRLAGYEVTLLPLYCKLANTHLFVLRDIVAFGSSYGFTPNILSSYYEDLKMRITRYTDHCVKTYDTGLELAKKQTAIINKNGNNPQYPWMFFPEIEGYDYQGVEDWNVFNTYRRTMTLLVLDWIAMWPTFDLKLYPVRKGLKTALTREIYTNIIGYHTLDKKFYWPWEDRPTLTREQIEKMFVRPPHLFTWLNQIDVRASHVNDITGIILKNSYTLDQHIDTTSIGTIENTSSSCSIIDYPITKINVKFNGREKPNFIEFESKNDKLTSCGYFIDRPYYSPINCGRDCEPRPAYSFTSLVPDINIANISTAQVPLVNKIPLHQLSWMYIGKSAAQNDYAIDAIGCAWTHPSVDTQNLLASNSITQIPAVMAKSLQKGAQVISGPGHTGGDLVKIVMGSFFELSVTLPTAVEQEYTLRIRCANTHAGDLTISNGFESIEVYIPENKHFDYKLKTYESFQLINVPSTFSLFTKQEHYTLYFGSHLHEIIIDKIEFIPQY